MSRICVGLLLLLAFSQCSDQEEPPSVRLSSIIGDAPSQSSNTADYINSPFLSAGDRAYLVGHQNGTFPDLGWHIPDEMGGLWAPPIKLLDGFMLELQDKSEGISWCLTDANQFINYPFAGKHRFENEDLGLSVTRTQFVPEGLVGLIVEVEVENLTQDRKELEIVFTGLVDLTPTWLWDSLAITDQKDVLEWDDSKEVVIARDEGNPWFVLFGSEKAIGDHYFVKSECYDSRKGLGMDGTVTSHISIDPNSSESVKFFVSGSSNSLDKALTTYDSLQNHFEGLLQAKIIRTNEIDQYSQIEIPDSSVQEMYQWIKYNTDWLITDVEGVGRGLAAGIPDYPWWFGTDNGYTLEGLLATGQHEEVRSTIDLIYKLSKQTVDNGRVVHEASNNGVVFNPGNLNTTARFIYLLWKYYEWTGDLKFLELYYPEAMKGLAWLESMDKDGNMYPDGHGMMEIHGLNSEMVDVVAYTQLAYQAASKMAEQLHYPDEAVSLQQKADQLKEKINTDWWVEESSSYADFQATRNKTIQLIKDAIIRADTLKKPWAVEELKETLQAVQRQRGNSSRGYVVHHNWVVNTPMETGLADPVYAQRALETAEKYTNRFGVFVTGIDRNEEQEQSSKWQSFSYVGAVMTLPTGVQAIAECNYGNPDKALDYLKMLYNSFGYALPGSLYEVSPDYGMISQAWTIYSVAVPIVEHFFGIKPEAYANRIVVSPMMPEQWNEVSISKVRVGTNEISYNYKFYQELDTYEFLQEDPEWTITLSLPTEGIKEVFVNDKKQDVDLSGDRIYVDVTGEAALVNIVREVPET